ncbi:hypothetical protein GT347_06050 [Xylophilus rhododendri]|uniref:Uncharacterized protein n=1 Tax=Xylophilus rhododendri TaxID=2697032 RepID=A0A857J3Y8_9BURK|nr:hypothetical protein [Xylophilus rhododendri]QHI97588.1 hypothetical protein GT347_06050 [Xylophilus rhododendri]
MRKTSKPLSTTLVPTDRPGDAPPRPASSQAILEQARDTLREVGTLARAATGIACDPILAGENFGDLRTRVRVLQLLVDRVGSVAESGLRRLDDGLA